MDQHTGTATPSVGRRRKRTTVVAIAAIAALSLVGSACGSSDKSEASTGTTEAGSGSSASTAPTEITKIKLGLPFAGAAGATPTDTSPVGYADSLGLAAPIFAEHGFELTETIGFQNGPPAIEALHSGSVEVVWVGDTPAVAAQASGKESRAILIQEPSGDAWFVSREGGPTTVEGFKGKKVGLQFGSNFDKYGRAVLGEAGVLDDTELVNLTFADALPALQRGDIDGYAIIASLGGIWQQKVPGLQVLAKASDGDGSLLSTAVVIVTPKFLEEHPTIQAAWWEAYQVGVTEIEKDPDAYFAWVSEVTGTPVEVVKSTTLLKFGDEPATENGIAALQSGLDFLVESGTAKESFDISEWVVEPTS